MVAYSHSLLLLGASKPELASNPRGMKQYIVSNAAKDQIKGLPKGPQNRILQSPVRGKIIIN